MSYATRIRNYKQCEIDQVLGRTTSQDCRMNWAESANAMEADIAIQLLKCTQGLIIKSKQLLEMMTRAQCQEFDVKSLRQVQRCKPLKK